MCVCWGGVHFAAWALRQKPAAFAAAAARPPFGESALAIFDLCPDARALGSPPLQEKTKVRHGCFEASQTVYVTQALPSTPQACPNKQAQRSHAALPSPQRVTCHRPAATFQVRLLLLGGRTEAGRRSQRSGRGGRGRRVGRRRGHDVEGGLRPRSQEEILVSRADQRDDVGQANGRLITIALVRGWLG